MAEICLGCFNPSCVYADMICLLTEKGSRARCCFQIFGWDQQKIQIMSGYDVHIIITLKGVSINVARMVVTSMSRLVRRICLGVIC